MITHHSKLIEGERCASMDATQSAAEPAGVVQGPDGLSSACSRVLCWCICAGAAGCAVAACLKKREELKGKSAVVLCCGGNMAVPTLRALLDKHAPRG